MKQPILILICIISVLGIIMALDMKGEPGYSGHYPLHPRYNTVNENCPYEVGKCQDVICNRYAYEHTYETDDLFFNGEILMPDYVHEDTLVVIDAVFLNRLMEIYNPESDGDISDMLRLTTRKRSPNGKP